ncbi:PEP-CTERM sorting domain-containing protein [Aquincola sp. S2]|uniref:PEP-CTERM sorting domain-containing protein n=1 Tax=Pseudaquabacterium terrae TaxID=2732868 RepID=A0ABX2EEI9_9BURK|nr:PEP-CTERM sorting domain-containing protein [Aquabacterium terrae]NRF67032.1 PEP-CTERM sorting domain-containing protein [Aquabacterium terrae]
MIRRFFAAVAALLLFQFQPAASAAVVTVHEVIDARDIVMHTGISDDHSPFTLAPGDILKIRFDFLPGQALQVVDLVALGVILNATDGADHAVTNGNAMSFFGLQGPAHDPAPNTTTTTGFGLLSVFYANDILDNPPHGVISFSGFEFTISLDSFSDGLSERTYHPAMMFVSGASIAVLPEPSTMLLVLLALGGIAAVRAGTRGRR